MVGRKQQSPGGRKTIQGFATFHGLERLAPQTGAFMTPKPSIPYAGLLALLQYTKFHHHSRFWIGPLMKLLVREGGH